MRNARGSGYTLVELLVTVAVASVLLTLAVPPLRAALDGVAAAGARDAFVALVARARLEAVRHGGARVVVDLGSGAAVVEDAGAAPLGDSLALAVTWGVTVSADGSSAGQRVAVDFDGHGLGRVASRTFRFRRRRAESRVSLSTYGRARRW